MADLITIPAAQLQPGDIIDPKDERVVIHSVYIEESSVRVVYNSGPGLSDESAFHRNEKIVVERPTPGPDPACAYCRHPESYHGAYDDIPCARGCDCQSFVDDTAPGTRPLRFPARPVMYDPATIHYVEALERLVGLLTCSPAQPEGLSPDEASKAASAIWGGR